MIIISVDTGCFHFKMLWETLDGCWIPKIPVRVEKESDLHTKNPPFEGLQQLEEDCNTQQIINVLQMGAFSCAKSCVESRTFKNLKLRLCQLDY